MQKHHQALACALETVLFRCSISRYGPLPDGSISCRNQPPATRSMLNDPLCTALSVAGGLQVRGANLTDSYDAFMSVYADYKAFWLQTILYFATLIRPITTDVATSSNDLFVTEDPRPSTF